MYNDDALTRNRIANQYEEIKLETRSFLERWITIIAEPELDFLFLLKSVLEPRSLRLCDILLFNVKTHFQSVV